VPEFLLLKLTFYLSLFPLTVVKAYFIIFYEFTPYEVLF